MKVIKAIQSENNFDACVPEKDLTEIVLCTNVRTRNFMIKWKIMNFNFCGGNAGEEINPSSFFTYKDQFWYLSLYPKGKEEGCEEYISLYLTPKLQYNLSTKVTFSLMDSKGKKRFQQSFGHVFSGDGYGYNKFLKRSELFNEETDLIPGGKVNVICKLQILDYTNEELYIKPKDNKVEFLSDILLKVLNNTELSDITLSVGGVEFKVHKVILAARSTVFNALFKHPQEDNKNNIIKIPYISPSAMEEVIRYIYSDVSPNIQGITEDVLKFADKYDIRGLKDICADVLCSQLAIDSAAHMLQLANLHNVSSLKENVLKFIGKHKKEVMKTSSWEELMSRNPMLAVQALTELLLDS